MEKFDIQDGGKRVSYGEGKAEREPTEGKGRFDLISPFALSRLARWYELGAGKYSDRNWEKGGIPFSRYTDSAMRHLNKFLMGMTDEDHLAAAAWNIFCMMHFQERGEKRDDDLPHYQHEESGDEEEEEDEVEKLKDRLKDLRYRLDKLHEDMIKDPEPGKGVYYPMYPYPSYIPYCNSTYSGECPMGSWGGE